MINGGRLEPSTRTEGPWRGVETVTSVLGQQTNAMPDIQATSQPVDSNAEFNEAMQQQLLLDLFWPGWPQHLPEPNIVNDLCVALVYFVSSLTPVSSPFSSSCQTCLVYYIDRVYSLVWPYRPHTPTSPIRH
jgi:hypothetical protein